MTDERGNRTLIAYASRGGVTREYSEIIAEVLRGKYGHEVDTVDIRKNKSPNVSGYDNVILGTGVRIQRVYKEGLNFLKKDFGGKRVAVFLSSNEAGTPDSYDDAVRKYMDPIRENHPNINLVDIEGFGGRIRVLGKTSVDLSDPEKAKSWAEQLGERLRALAGTP
jgi:menaquinone-dependent protoporphyrinogen IX oxidase